MNPLPGEFDGVTPPSASPLGYAGPNTITKTDREPELAPLVCAVLFLPALGFAIRTGGISIFFIMMLILPVFAIALGASGLARHRREGRGAGVATVLGVVLGAVEVSLLAVMLMTASSGRASPAANRVTCASNLRRIGVGLSLYAAENQGQFPPSFDELMLTQDMTLKVLVCPASDDTLAVGPTTQAALQQLHAQGGHCSYLYVGGGLTLGTATSRHVVAYEPLVNHGSSGINVLYGDGMAIVLPKAEAKYVLAELKAGHNPPRPKNGMPFTMR